MKKFLIVILTLMYVGVSSGIALDYHYCMGKLADVNVWHDDTCASCGEKEQPSPCCSTETQLLKLSADQNVTPVIVTDFTPVAVDLLFAFITSYSLLSGEETQVFTTFYDLPPECRQVPLFIHNCTFLI